MTLALKNAMLEYLFKMLAPEVVEPEKQKVKAEEFDRGDLIVKKLKPGDIIFTQTPNILYEMMRNVVGMQYDHVCVVINSHEAIHISPPRISRLNLRYVTLPRQHPLILRPNLTNPDRFLSELHLFLGDKYSYESVIGAALKVVKRDEELTPINLEELKQKKICSNVVMYCLCQASPEFAKLLTDRLHTTNYRQLGSFLPDSVYSLLTCSPKTELVHREDNLSYNNNKLLFDEISEILRSREPNTTKLLKVVKEVLRRLEDKTEGVSLGKIISVLLTIVALKRMASQSLVLRVIKWAISMAGPNKAQQKAKQPKPKL